MILVTGASGFLGSSLVPRLVRQRLEPVRILLHRKDPGWEGLEQVVGDVTRPRSLAEAVRGVDTIIHLVAIIRERPGRTFLGINYLGTKNVVQAAEQAGVQRLLLLSAIGAGPEERFPYLYSKWLAEEVIKGSRLTWTVLRSSIIYGERDEFSNKLADLVRRRLGSAFPVQGGPLARLGRLASGLPVVPVVGSGKTPFQPIWVEDVVAILLKTIDAQVTFGRTVELGGPEHISYQGMLEAIMDALGEHPLKVHVPLVLMRPMVRLMSALLPDFPVTPQQLDMLQVSNTTVPDAVERIFGFRPTPFQEGIAYLRSGSAR